MEEFARSPRAGCALAGLLILFAVSGCGRPERTPEPKASSAPQEKAAAPRAKAVEAPAQVPPPPAEARPAGPPPAPPVAETPVPAPVAKKAPPAAPVKVGTPAEPAPAKEAKPAPARPPQPQLDLVALEQRLKDTDAIGFMTKLTLKNQVDELLGRFEAHHDGTDKASLSELRPPFDLLILKVLSLLQDRDAPLASAISTSREAMWSILADPAKFRSFLTQNRS